MDDEDDRRLLDFIGDVQDLNDYLHGSCNKSIEEDDLTNATYGSADSFFTSDTGGSDEGLKDGHNHLEEFGEAAGARLQLSSSLQFIEDELQGDISPSGIDLGGEDQPFDILQKSLLEADITEQTLAQEALLESQPSLAPATTTFPQQLASGGFGGVPGAGVMGPLPLAGAQPQAFIQQVPQLPLANGPTGHIQLVGSFNGGAPSMMTINSLERPQILLRPGGNAVTSNTGQGAGFGPSAPGQVSVPFNKGAIPLQNIIIQRGPAPQTLVRPIQPKPLQTGGQTVYNISNIGIQPNNVTPANPANSAYTTSGSPQTTQQVKVVSQGTSIVVHSPIGQQGQPQAQSSLPQGQFLLPSSLALTTGSSVHGFQAVNGQVLQTNSQVGGDSLTSTTTYSILTNQNTTVQIIAGQNFTAGGQLIVNQGIGQGIVNQIGQVSPTAVVQVSQRPGVTAKVWTTNASPSPVTPSHSTMVNSAAQGLQPQQQISVCSGSRLLVPVTQNATSSSYIAGQELQQVPLNQDSNLPIQKGQTQLVNLLGTKGMKTLSTATHEPLMSMTPKRPAPQQLTRGTMILQQLRKDHTGVMSTDRGPFTSLNDVIDRLLPYHVFQGAPPCEEDFTKVDEEFQAAATQVLKRTQAMVNKYRRLLMVEAERSSPSSEIVMIDRTFNQEERSSLTQDKRTVLVDPDGFLEEFCCGPKKMISNSGAMDSFDHDEFPSLMGTSPSQELKNIEGSEEGRDIYMEPAYRTESYSAFEDPGGGQLRDHGETAIKITIDMKKKKANNVFSSSSHHHRLHDAQHSTSPIQSQHNTAQLYLPEPSLSLDHGHVSLADTDSVLEAAVNSILEC
ncbi:BRD4-interacting chromatin-remodeling complex-associated protein-like isoform X2 [Hoplias malabaricus]